MSIFGQVWVFSAIAFVLGAFLAWLFLVRPAQRRVRELERRLAAAESFTPAPIQAEPRRESAFDGAAHGDEADPVAPMPSTRQFTPSEPAPAEMTQQISPATDWPERDSLQGFYPATEPGGADDDIERWQQEQDQQDRYGGPDVTAVLDADDSMRSAPEPEPEPYAEPQAYAEQRAYEEQHSYENEPETYRDTYYDEQPYHGHEEPEPVHEAEPEPEPEQPRRAPSLFEPMAYEPQEEPGTARHRSDENEQPEPESPPAYAFGDPGETPEAEPAVEQTQVLPKRKPRQSPPGGFEPPKPIQPSMRAVTRREPEPDGGAHSGSLFEPAVAPGPAAGATPPAREPGTGDALPPGPFGPGSAMPRPGGGKPSEEYTVKASVTALRYCTEDSPQFPRMVAEVWFRTPADAERVGFRPLT